MKKTTLLVLALVLIVSTASVYAYYGHGGYGRGRSGNYGRGRSGGYGCGMGMMSGRGHMGGYGMNGGGYGYQNMTEAKRNQLNTIDQKYFSQFESLDSNMRIQSSIINSEMASANPNMGKVNSAIEKRANLQVQLQKLGIAQENEVRKVLQ